MTTETSLIPHQSVVALVATYQKANEEIATAFSLLDKAKKRLKEAGIRHTVLTHNVRDFDLPRECQVTLTMVRQNTWRFIIGKCNIREYLTRTRHNELEKQLSDDKLPEIEVENIHEFIQSLAAGTPDLLMEFISETFDLLRPPNSEYKTNTEYEIGEKVILSWMIDVNYGFVSLRSHAQKSITSLDNCFHLLDGKGVAKYPQDASTQIRNAISNDQWECETEYFAFRWYKKGSLHIRFKRMDLVRRLNQIAGKNRLKNK